MGFRKISVVVPMYNEEEAVGPLYAQLSQELGRLGCEYELIFVDDGSQDGTYQRLKELHEQDKRVRVVRLRRNFGQTAALSAGFDYAEGEVIVTLDGDLQNDPRDIGRLLVELEKGYDIVSGWRKERKDPFFTRRLPSILANKFISWLTNVRLHDYGCTLKAYRKEVIDSINLYGEMHRFIPALASWAGARISEVVVSHNPRRYGKSKYGLNRIYKVLLDSISVKFLLSFSTRPIQVFGGIGLVILSLSFVFSGLFIYMKLAQNTDITGNPLFYAAIFFAMIGIQFVVLGLLAELNIRIYHESQKKPIYVVKEVLE